MPKINHWLGYGLAVFLGAAMAITAGSAFAQLVKQRTPQYKVVQLHKGSASEIQSILNENSSQWRLHSVYGSAGVVVFERK